MLKKVSSYFSDTSSLMLFTEIIVMYCKNLTKYVDHSVWAIYSDQYVWFIWLPLYLVIIKQELS